MVPRSPCCFHKNQWLKDICSYWNRWNRFLFLGDMLIFWGSNTWICLFSWWCGDFFTDSTIANHRFSPPFGGNSCWFVQSPNKQIYGDDEKLAPWELCFFLPKHTWACLKIEIPELPNVGYVKNVSWRIPTGPPTIYKWKYGAPINSQK